MSRLSFEVQPDQEQLRDAIRLFKLVDGNAGKAVQVAINKAGPKIRTRASREIRDQVRLKAGYVNKRLKFQRSRGQTLEGRITAPSRGLLLSKFSTDSRVAGDNISWVRPPDEPKRGIRVKVKPRGGTKAVSGDGETKGKPFYMVLPKSRRIGIAARRLSPGPEGGKIKVFYGPSLSQVFNDVKDDMTPEAEAEYTFQLLDAMRYLLVKEYPLT